MMIFHGFLYYTRKIDYANQNCPYEIVKEYPKMVMFHALPILDTLQKNNFFAGERKYSH